MLTETRLSVDLEVVVVLDRKELGLRDSLDVDAGDLGRVAGHEEAFGLWEEETLEDDLVIEEAISKSTPLGCAVKLRPDA